MKKIAVVVAIVLAFLALGGTVYAAQDSLPGDASYLVKMGVEGTAMMLQRDDVARAQRALNFADKRVKEMAVLTERGRLQDLGLAVERYCYALNMSMIRMEQQVGRGGSRAGDIAKMVAEAIARHLSTLNGLYDVVADQAKPVIVRAMVEAWKCYQRAIQVREQLRLQVSGIPTIPATIRERVEQWIREGAGA